MTDKKILQNKEVLRYYTNKEDKDFKYIYVSSITFNSEYDNKLKKSKDIIIESLCYNPLFAFDFKKMNKNFKINILKMLKTKHPEAKFVTFNDKEYNEYEIENLKRTIKYKKEDLNIYEKKIKTLKKDIKKLEKTLEKRGLRIV